MFSNLKRDHKKKTLLLNSNNKIKSKKYLYTFDDHKYRTKASKLTIIIDQTNFHDIMLTQTSSKILKVHT